MISKNVFVDTLKFMEERENMQEVINKVLSEEFEDCIFYPYFKYESQMLKVLEDAMHDTGEMISYFIYELDFGQEYKEGCVTENNNEIIDISTAEKLYDYLELHYNDKREMNYL